MSGGSSGGGWVNASGAVNGLISYGYELDFDHLYGPYFGDRGASSSTSRRRARRCSAAGTQVTNLGGAGPNDFSGADVAETFKLKGDADRARGFGGDDTACGGDGDDKLKGGEDADTCAGATAATSSTAAPASTSASAAPAATAAPAASKGGRSRSWSAP